MNLKYQKLNPLSMKPERKSEGACGYDLYAINTVSLIPGVVTIVETGIGVELPKGYFGWITDRSTWGFLGVLCLQGKIDSDYRGEIKVGMININKEPITINAGDRFCQLIIMKHEVAKTIEVAELSRTPRGIGGFGSTGRR